MPSEPITQEPIAQINTPGNIPALPAPSETGDDDRRAAARADARSSGAKTAGCILVWLLRLGLLVVVIAALVAAVYFGWPIVYTRYILPVQTNTARIAVLETHQQSGQEQVSALETQLPALAAAQAGQSPVLTEQAARIATLESSLNERSQALTALREAQAGQAAALTAVAPRVNALESAMKEHSRTLANLQSTQASLQAGEASRRAGLDQQVALLKSMELLSRARLFLYESNFGLAKQDIQAARDLLAALPGYSLDQDLAEVVQRLDQTLSRLPDFPVAASDDLDIAWQILLGGQTVTPISPTASESTPTPAEAQDSTPTPTTAP